jgi:hypothetical protein
MPHALVIFLLRYSDILVPFYIVSLNAKVTNIGAEPKKFEKIEKKKN